jgi:hypothetical protein
LKPTILREAEHYRTVWQISVDKDETRQSILEPSFWAHVAARLRPQARIEVLAADGSWFSELIVRSIGPSGARPTEARVSELRHVDLDLADAAAMKAADDAPMTAVYKGPTVKWGVQHGNVLLVSGLANKQAAMDWIANPPQEREAA